MHVAAGHVVLPQEVEQPAVGGQVLALLPGGKGPGDRPEARPLQTVTQALAVQGQHIGVGDHGGGAPRPGDPGDVLPGLSQQAAADLDVVFSGCRNVNRWSSSIDLRLPFSALVQKTHQLLLVVCRQSVPILLHAGHKKVQLLQQEVLVF